jgi:hypothetical protein
MVDDVDLDLDIEVDDVQVDVEIAPAQQKALDGGWRPKEEWEGDPSDWVDYREFNFRGELMDRIRKESGYNKRLHNEVDALKDAIKQLGEHNQKIAKHEYDRAMKELKVQRREAIEERDYDLLDTVEDQMEQLKGVYETKEVEEPKERPNENEQDLAVTEHDKEVYADFVKKSTWYDKDIVMTGAADKLAVMYKNQNYDASAEEVIDYITTELKKEFPHKFGNPAKKKPTSVADGRSYANDPGKGKQKFTVRDLSPEQRKIGKTFVDSGAFKSIQEYVDQLADIGELGE